MLHMATNYVKLREKQMDKLIEQNEYLCDWIHKNILLGRSVLSK